MTTADVMAKWTRDDFEDLQSRDHFSDSTTYEKFIEMKFEQAELARKQKIELFGEDLDEVPYEEPPEMTLEDEAALIRAWAAVAAEMAAAENESHPRQVELGQHIVSDPEICGGDLTFKGTRILVKDVLDTVAQGWDWDKISEAWDGRISREAIAEAVALANEALAEKTEQRWLRAA